MKIGYFLINLILLYEIFVFVYRYNPKDEPGFGLAISGIMTFLINNIIALLLTVLQVYSLKYLTVGIALAICILVGILWKKEWWASPRELLRWITNHRYHVIPMIVFLAAMVLYLVFPTKYMLGGRDPGVYLLNGIHISRTGAMQYKTDEYLNDHYEELKDVLFPGYPALFTPERLEGMDGEPGEISPQFMPMFPSALAIGNDLGGIEGLIRVNAIIGVLSLLMLYYLAKRFFSQKAASIMLIMMLFQPAQLWGARITETEILSQLLLFASMYCMMAGWKNRCNWQFALAGFLLGIGCMNRIDTYIYGVGLIAGTLYCVLWRRDYLRKMILVDGVYGLLGLISLLYGWEFSHIYIVEHWQAGVLSKIVLFNVFGMLGVVVIYCIGKIGGFRVPNVVMWIIKSRKNLLVAFGALLLLFLYAYIFRPWGSMDFVKRTMIEFCWYTSVPMVLLAMYGLYCIFKDKQEESEQYFAFFLIALASVFIYIISPSVASDHIWAGRRWITVNIPFIMLLGAYGIEKCRFVRKSVQRLVQGVLTVGITGFLVYQCKPFLFTCIMEDLDQQYEELVADLRDDVVYLTTNQQIASYLRYVYNKQVYLMSEEKQENYREYLAKQEYVDYIGSESALGTARYYYEYELEPERHTLSGKYLEKTVGRFPRTLYDRRLPASVYHLTYGGRSEFRLGEDEIQTGNANYNQDGEICADGREGIIFYGPYISLEAGEYAFYFEIEAKNFDSTRVEVSCDAGDTILSELAIGTSGEIILPFKLTEETDGIETRLWAGMGSDVVCKNLFIRKIN